MFYIKRNLLSVVLLVAAAVMSGCGSYSEKKAAMVDGWERTTAIAKIPMAEELAANGKYDEAADILAKCLLSAPKSPAVHLAAGKVYYMQSMISSAQDSLRNSLKYDDSMDEAWFMLGVIAEGEGSTTKAFDHYSRAMELKPSRSGYVIALAELKSEMGDDEGALELLRKKSDMLYAASELKVALAEMLVRQGDVDDAIVLYNRLLASEGDEFAYLVPLGYCYVIKKDWGEGARVFSRLVEKSDDQGRDTYIEMLGMCSLNNKDYVQAMKCYDRLSVKRRGDADVWLRMGQAAFGANVPARALVCAKKAYALRPGSGDAIMLKACVEYAQGDYAKAFESFGQISSKKELASFVEMMMTLCYERMGKDVG